MFFKICNMSMVRDKKWFETKNITTADEMDASTMSHWLDLEAAEI